MKTKISTILFNLAIIILLVLTSCKGPASFEEETEDTSQANWTKWEYQPSIKEPVKAVAGLEPVELADETGQVNVSIPMLAFNSATELTLKNPTDVPEVDSNKFTPIGAPIEIEGAKKRLNRSAELIFHVDPVKYAEELKNGEIWITYYDGEAWEYFPPDSVDISTGKISFTTYHFSIFGSGEITEQERLNQFAHQQAVLSFAQQDAGQSVQALAKKASEAIAIKLGLKDPEYVSELIVDNLHDRNDIVIMAGQLYSGEFKEFGKTLSLFISKQILEEGMITVSPSVPTLALARFIESEAKLVQAGINSWREEEVEAAFQVYKKGDQGGGSRGFFGYFMNTRDFEELWGQMGGVSRQLEAEAVQQEISRRLFLDLPEPTAEELDAIREKAKADLKKRFDERLKNEGAIAKEEARIKSLMGEFQKAKLLEKWSFGYDPNQSSMEARLNQLFTLTSKIMRDTGRSQWISGAISTAKEISTADLVSLMQAWFISPEEYARELDKRFGKAAAATATSGPTLEPTTSLVIKPTSTEINVPTPTSLFKSHCAGSHLLEFLAPNYLGQDHGWGPENNVSLYVLFIDGTVSVDFSTSVLPTEINGTYDEEGNFTFTFTKTLQDWDDRKISGTVTGQFYNIETYGCDVKGTVTGVVTDLSSGAQTDFTSELTNAY